MPKDYLLPWKQHLACHPNAPKSYHDRLTVHLYVYNLNNDPTLLPELPRLTEAERESLDRWYFG